MAERGDAHPSLPSNRRMNIPDTTSHRERVIELIAQMRKNTVENGCTPGEAAKFAAKVAELLEKYQINEAETKASASDEVEIAQNFLRTGKKAFNPGMTRVVDGLATGMCCKVVQTHKWSNDLKFHEAVYGIVGDALDCDYVCQIAVTVVPALRIMAALEGAEHGYEGAGLTQWNNQYLVGAGIEIQRRLETERKKRSQAKSSTCTALVVTGESLATIKREHTKEAFELLYPKTRTTYSRSNYNHTARERGREAGRNVGLNISIEE